MGFFVGLGQRHALWLVRQPSTLHDSFEQTVPGAFLAPRNLSEPSFPLFSETLVGLSAPRMLATASLYACSRPM